MHLTRRCSHMKPVVDADALPAVQTVAGWLSKCQAKVIWHGKYLSPVQELRPSSLSTAESMTIQVSAPLQQRLRTTLEVSSVFLVPVGQLVCWVTRGVSLFILLSLITSASDERKKIPGKFEVPRIQTSMRRTCHDRLRLHIQGEAVAKSSFVTRCMHHGCRGAWS
jgi:hypothetical protein